MAHLIVVQIVFIFINKLTYLWSSKWLLDKLNTVKNNVI